MAKTTQPPTEWTPEVDANWKNPSWWETGTAKEHLDMDALFDKHINQDFRLSTWVELAMGQEVYFVASAGGLLKRIVRGYDYTEDNYFLWDTTRNSETKVKPERIWLKPEDALIYKLREHSTDMLGRVASSPAEDVDKYRKHRRRMLRFMLQQLESL